jgi:acetylglutamate kinase
VKQIVEELLTDIENLRKNINFKAHVGDTPVKIVHEYPRMIEKKITVQQLCEQFNQQMSQDSPKKMDSVDSALINESGL